MIYRILADGVVIIHLLFILFVLFGGFALIRYPKIVWAHAPAFIWAVILEFFGLICPLTYLENYFRRLGVGEGYAGGFIEYYILPIIYPGLLFDGEFPRWGFVMVGVFVLLLNIMLYLHFFRQNQRQNVVVNKEGNGI